MEARLESRKNFNNGSKMEPIYKITKNARKICENQISEYLKMI